jgi:hypothetical protein
MLGLDDETIIGMMEISSTAYLLFCSGTIGLERQ